MIIKTSSTWNRLILIFAKTLRITISAEMITAAQMPLSRESPLLFDMVMISSSFEGESGDGQNP
jgi:hypothetical protein